MLSGLVRGGHIAGEVGSWHRVGQDILRVVGHGLGGEHHLDIVGGPGVEHLDDAAVGYVFVGIEGDESGSWAILRKGTSASIWSGCGCSSPAEP